MSNHSKMAAYFRLGDVIRLVLLLYFSTQVSTQDIRKRMCLQFKRCSYSSPLCLILFSYFTCTDFKDLEVNEPACGLSTQTGSASKYPMPRVVGGIPAGDREFPWTVNLDLGGCGGSIIDSDTILTAAHCVENWVSSPSRHSVGYGSVNRSRLIYLTVRNVVIHPNYTSQNSDNDIAVVTLNQKLPLDESTNLRSICLPEPQRTYTPGRNCIITGWGLLIDGGFVIPETLQKASVPLVPLEECQRVYADNSQIFVSERQLCAGYFLGGVDSCRGDSGGPLFCADGDKWVLQGVISIGEGCARPGFPGVYAYVPQHVNWIKSQMNGN